MDIKKRIIGSKLFGYISGTSLIGVGAFSLIKKKLNWKCSTTLIVGGLITNIIANKQEIPEEDQENEQKLLESFENRCNQNKDLKSFVFLGSLCSIIGSSVYLCSNKSDINLIAAATSLSGGVVILISGEMILNNQLILLSIKSKIENILKEKNETIEDLSKKVNTKSNNYINPFSFVVGMVVGGAITFMYIKHKYIIKF